MKNNKIILRGAIFGIVALMVLGTLSSVAFATLISNTPEVIPAPESVVDDASDGGAENEQPQAFDEAQGVVLEEEVSCDEGSLSAGTKVNSHMIFYNTPVGTPYEVDSDRVWEFDGNIICVMSDQNGLLEEASNDVLGADGTSYPEGFAGRGLEGVDLYTVTDNKITITMAVSEPGDWIRVVTEWVDTEAPTVPVLTWPIDGVIIKDNSPLMQWDDSSDDSGIAGYYYKVKYNCSDTDDSNTCVSLYSNETGLWRDTSEYQAGITTDGTYYWQVRSKDNSGNLSDWSELEKVVIDTEAPIITFVEPLNNSVQSGIISLQATCNEDCDYVNFWWRAEGESFSSDSKRYHYVGKDGTLFEWDLNSLDALKADGTTYEMKNGAHYLYAAGKDLTGNWARTPEIKIIIKNTSDNGNNDDDDDGNNDDNGNNSNHGNNNNNGNNGNNDEKNQCKNGGWRNMNGVSFKNQGACVSSFVKNQKANKNK